MAQALLIGGFIAAFAGVAGFLGCLMMGLVGLFRNSSIRDVLAHEASIEMLFVLSAVLIVVGPVAAALGGWLYQM